MWIYRHWRLVAGGVFTLLAGLAIIAVLVAFPPALPFFAGFVALSASALIPIVTALAMAAAAFFATLFNVVCKLLSDAKSKSWGEWRASVLHYQHRTAKYGSLKALAYSFLIGAAAFVITAIVTLIGGAAFLSAPVWIAAGTALAIGFGIGVLLHVAFFGSLRLDNYCGQQRAENEQFENPKEADVNPFAEPDFAPAPEATNDSKAKKLRNPGQSLDSASKETKTPRPTSKTTKTLNLAPTPRATQPLAPESMTTAPLNKPRPPSEPNPHRAKSPAEGSDAQPAPKPVPTPPPARDGKSDRRNNHNSNKKKNESAPVDSSDASPSPKDQTANTAPTPAPVEGDINETSEQAKLLIAQLQKMAERKARREAEDNSSSPATTPR